jgi:outer membrane receptor protein involved in Fe transport
MSVRLAGVYNLPYHGMFAKIIYGSSFKPPSPFELYHEPIALNASRSDPFLISQSANTLEAVWGMRPLTSLHLSTTFFFTDIQSLVSTFKIEEGIDLRNANAQVLGMEASVEYLIFKQLSGYLNFTILPWSAYSPQKKPQETDLSWEGSVYNTTVPVGMFPSLMVNAVANLRLPRQHLNINLGLRYVGERRASMTNNQLFNATSLERTYTLDQYLVTDLSLSTLDLKWWDQRETTFWLVLRGFGGAYVEPGFGGIDLPSLGPALHFGVSQMF